MRQSPVDQSPDMLRLTVPEAAKALGISPEAVRNRLSRGTLESVKVDGTVYVLIDRDRTRHTADTPNDRSNDRSSAGALLISEMRSHIADLRAQLEAERTSSAELRRLVAALTQRIPEIEAPPEQRQPPPAQSLEEAAQGVAQAAPGANPTQGDTGESRGPERVPWWRRVFGVE